MGLFTSPTPSRRSTTTPLKRRSLGRASTVKQSDLTLAAPATLDQEHVSLSSQSQQQSHATTSLTTQKIALCTDDDGTDAEEELPDLQSDDTILYQRAVPLSLALGTYHPNTGRSLMVQIEQHVRHHYLDCFGIRRVSETISDRISVIPFQAKAPRFISIHALKRKDLERDFTEVQDTSETCARKQICLGRCLLGQPCPTPD